MCLRNLVQEHIDLVTIQLLDGLENSNKSIAKPNQNLQIYTNHLPKHLVNFIGFNSNPTYKPSSLQDMVSMVNAHPQSSQVHKIPNPIISLYSTNMCIGIEDGPLYIPTKFNEKTINGVLVDPNNRVNVITQDFLYINQFYQDKYDDSKVNIWIHGGMSLPTRGFITLLVQIGPKCVDTILSITPTSNLFYVELEISWINSMEVFTSMDNKCLKFQHDSVL